MELVGESDLKSAIERLELVMVDDKSVVAVTLAEREVEAILAVRVDVSEDRMVDVDGKHDIAAL